MNFLVIILIIIICVCSTLIFLILKKDLLNGKKRHKAAKKTTKDLVKNEIPVKEIKPIISSKDDVEVLELYPNNQKGMIKDMSDDTLNLNELFKTISMEAVNDDTSFDFGLRRQEKK